MEMIKVKSNNIHAIGHEGDTLRVQFKDTEGKPGAIWNYSGVKPHIHQELMKAESIGSYFSRMVKPHHRGAKHVVE